MAWEAFLRYFFQVFFFFSFFFWLNETDLRELIISVCDESLQRDFYPEESVEGAVLHVFSDDHNRIGLGDDALKINDVEMFKLAHYWSFRQEIDAGLVRTAQFQRLDGHQHLRTRWHFQIAAANIAEFSSA